VNAIASSWPAASLVPPTTENRMMITAKHIDARRDVICLAHSLGAWDGMTGPLRVGVVGANPNRGWAND
jgi:hypothetical protein